MTKTLRSDEEEKDSSLCWPEAKKQMRNDEDRGRNADVGEDILAWLLVDDDGDLACGDGVDGSAAVAAADELAELLAGTEKSHEGANDAARKVQFTEDPYRSSSPPPPAATAGAVAGGVQTTPSSYVTINGNDETCGSSFSDCHSSVMASIDTSGLGYCVGPIAADTGGALGSRAEDGGACGVVGGGEDDLDCGFEWDGDDESLRRFLDDVFAEQGSVA